MKWLGMLSACKLKSNDVLFKVKKQEKIEKSRRNKEQMYLRNQETQNMLESLDNYYNNQMTLLKTQLKTEKINNQTLE